MKKIMFVCTGNICRSAMAHHYMQKKINEMKKEEEVVISSCGTSANPNEKSTTNAIECMKVYDTDLTNHRAINMFEIDIENYDLIFCMTNQHKNSVLFNFPKLKGKVYTLKEYNSVNDNENVDIDDPWGYSMSIYEACSKEIVENVDKFLKKL